MFNIVLTDTRPIARQNSYPNLYKFDILLGPIFSPVIYIVWYD